MTVLGAGRGPRDADAAGRLTYVLLGVTGVAVPRAFYYTLGRASQQMAEMTDAAAGCTAGPLVKRP